MVILQHDLGPIIVEVKRYSKKIGVELVRTLRGVQLRDDIKHAILVTSSTFTRDAYLEANHPGPLAYGFRLDLMDANDVLRELRLLGGAATLADLAGSDTMPRDSGVAGLGVFPLSKYAGKSTDSLSMRTFYFPEDSAQYVRHFRRGPTEEADG